MKKKPCTRRKKITPEKKTKRIARINAAIEALTNRLQDHPELMGIHRQVILDYVSKTMALDYRRDMPIVEHIETSLDFMVRNPVVIKAIKAGLKNPLTCV